MMKFVPNFTVIHNGMTLQAGSPVEITERDAEALKDYGRVEQAVKAAAPAKKGKKEQAKVADEDVI